MTKYNEISISKRNLSEVDIEIFKKICELNKTNLGDYLGEVIEEEMLIFKEHNEDVYARIAEMVSTWAKMKSNHNR